MLGVSLDELGISLINIRSTGFRNVAVLFHNTRIRKRCGIITDLDAAFIDTTQIPSDEKAVAKAKKAIGAQAAGISRKTALGEFSKDNPWVEPFFADHTFEVDFVAAGNSSKVVAVLSEVYKDGPTIAASKAELESRDVVAFGQRVLTMATNAGKGWFAILVGKMIDHHTIIPDYVVKAIFFAHGPISKAIVFNILSYRLSQISMDPGAGPAAIAVLNGKLEGFRDGVLDFAGIREAMLEAFPADEINNILAGL